MTYLQYSTLVYFGTFLLCVFLYMQWRSYRLDKLRFKLFAIRSRLFAEAERGALSFDDEAYKIVRHNINGMIRYSHKLSLLSLFLFKRVRGKSYHEDRARVYNERVRRAVHALSPEGREVVNNCMKAMHHEVIAHVSLNSLPAIILTSILFFWFLLDAIFKKVMGSPDPIEIDKSQPYERLSRKVDALDTEINEIGCLA